MGNHTSYPLMEACLDEVCKGRQECFFWPRSRPDVTWSKAYNLDHVRAPRVIMRPKDTPELAQAIKCATRFDFKVQARSGGHSYGNFGMGGLDKGGFMIDLVNFKDFELDTNSWQAAFGSGYKLGELDRLLHKNGARAFPHGMCPSVGIGGHATVGGLGPAARMWGTTLDHVVEVEVVTGDGMIIRASEVANADLFWALRGAGAGFGIITEFVVKTHPEPPKVLECTYGFAVETQEEVGPLFEKWQDLVYDPNLDRRFSTLFIVEPLGALITGTFYGTKEEYAKTGIEDRLPSGGVVNATVTDWMGSLAHLGEISNSLLTDLPNHFTAKSLVFYERDKLSRKSIREIFKYLASTNTGSMLWFIVFSSEGGAISEVSQDATSYPHRDAVMMYQAYTLGMPNVDIHSRFFMHGLHNAVRAAAPHTNMTYAGYVDFTLNKTAAQWVYWGKKVPQLQKIKRNYDPNDRFRNPQSIGLPWENRKGRDDE